MAVNYTHKAMSVGLTTSAPNLHEAMRIWNEMATQNLFGTLKPLLPRPTPAWVADYNTEREIILARRWLVGL